MYLLCKYIETFDEILHYLTKRLQSENVKSITTYVPIINMYYCIAGSVIFESKVSALFWAVYLEEFSAEIMSTVVPSAQYLYEELMLTPYMARFVVLHKPHSPHAWCDSLRVICVTDDKAEVRKVPIFFNYLFTF